MWPHRAAACHHLRLTADTGWTPVIPIEQTLADLLDYWRRASGE